jgi:hypothetical protein
MSLGYRLFFLARVVCCFLFPTDDMIVIQVLDNALWRFGVHLGLKNLRLILFWCETQLSRNQIIHVCVDDLKLLIKIGYCYTHQICSLNDIRFIY